MKGARRASLRSTSGWLKSWRPRFSTCSTPRCAPTGGTGSSTMSSRSERSWRWGTGRSSWSGSSFLEGKPVVTKPGPVQIGADVLKVHHRDLKAEHDAVKLYNEMIKLCADVGGHVTKVLLGGDPQ